MASTAHSGWTWRTGLALIFLLAPAIGFRGYGCSACAWVFKPSGAPTGNSFDEMMRNFELQRDKEFTSHVCADHPGARA